MIWLIPSSRQSWITFLSSLCGSLWPSDIVVGYELIAKRIIHSSWLLSDCDVGLSVLPGFLSTNTGRVSRAIKSEVCAPESLL